MPKSVINLPEESGTYKVVQLRLDGTLYIRFPINNERTMHSYILEDFLNEHKIPFDTITDLEKFSAPALKGDRYEVLGMGRAEINVDERTARLYGFSLSYEIPINRPCLQEISLNGWKIN